MLGTGKHKRDSEGMGEVDKATELLLHPSTTKTVSNRPPPQLSGMVLIPIPDGDYAESTKIQELTRISRISRHAVMLSGPHLS